MRKVLHKVKSHWIVLGVMGATVVALGAADVQKVSAAEVEGAGVIETNQAATSSSVSNLSGYIFNGRNSRRRGPKRYSRAC